VKKLSLLFFVIGSGCIQTDIITIQQDFIFQNVYYNQATFHPGTASLNPDHFFARALFAWDLNGVIFDNDDSWLNGVKKMWNDGYSIREIYTIFSKALTLLEEKKRLKKLGDPRGYVWDALLTHVEQSDPDFVKILRKFTIKANTLNYTTVTLLRELADRGHTNVVLSNMGMNVLETQMIFLESQLLENEDLTRTQQDLIRFALTFLANHEHNTIAGPHNGWLHKPKPLVYTTNLSCNQLLNASDGSILFRLKVFIDDKLENILAALENGFDIGIVYKNPVQLQKTLASLSHGRFCHTY